MIRRGAAAAADDVDQAALRELADQAGHVFRAFVVLAEFIGQPGVRIGADQGVGDTADIGDVGAQILGAKRAVEADGNGPRVTDRIPERLRQLAGKKPAGFVGDGARNYHGNVDTARLGDLRDGIERRLGVQGIEDGFQQQQIDAAVEQAVDLLAIGLAQVIEADGAEAGVGDVGRDRGGPVGRADRAGDKARLAVLGTDAGRGVTRQFCAFKVHLIGDARKVVVGLRDRGRRKGVGGDDIGAGAEIAGVNILDRAGLGQDQEVVVASEVAMEIPEAVAAKCRLIVFERLDHGAHGTIEHQNALAGSSKQGGSLRGHRHVHRIRRLSGRFADGCRANG